MGPPNRSKYTRQTSQHWGGSPVGYKVLGPIFREVLVVVFCVFVVRLIENTYKTPEVCLKYCFFIRPIKLGRS